VIPFRIPTRTEDPKLPPANAGAVVAFPIVNAEPTAADLWRHVAELAEAMGG
jgi:hypothetical protein